jgi:hypothetical protein
MDFVYSFLGSIAAVVAVIWFLLWVYSGPRQNPHDEMNRS